MNRCTWLDELCVYLHKLQKPILYQGNNRLKVKVTWVLLCFCDDTRGQYSALSKAWQFYFITVFLQSVVNEFSLFVSLCADAFSDCCWCRRDASVRRSCSNRFRNISARRQQQPRAVSDELSCWCGQVWNEDGDWGWRELLLVDRDATTRQYYCRQSVRRRTWCQLEAD